MPTVHLGNPAAVDPKSGAPLDPHPDGEHVTTSDIPDDRPLAAQILTVTHSGGAWAKHSDAPAPTWVESDSPELAAALSAAFGGIPIGRPAAAVQEG